MGTANLDARAALKFLSPELHSMLAGLEGAPAAVAESAAQLLPFGSRAALEALGVVELVGGNGLQTSRLHLTDFGYAVIGEAAVQANLDPAGLVDWAAEGQGALEEIEARAARGC